MLQISNEQLWLIRSWIFSQIQFYFAFIIFSMSKNVSFFDSFAKCYQVNNSYPKKESSVFSFSRIFKRSDYDIRSVDNNSCLKKKIRIIQWYLKRNEENWFERREMFIRPNFLSYHDPNFRKENLELERVKAFISLRSDIRIKEYWFEKKSSQKIENMKK
jgi:hypothetical protein